MPKKTIGIDMDDVLVATTDTFIREVQKIRGRGFTHDTLAQSFEKEHTSPEDEALFYEIMTRPDFFRDLPWNDPAGQEVVARLAEAYELYIVTAAMHLPSSIQGKMAWLQAELPFIPTSHYVFCGKKDIIHTDYLIDDNIDRFPGYRGTGICYNSFINRRREISGLRVDYWREIEAYFFPQEG